MTGPPQSKLCLPIVLVTKTSREATFCVVLKLNRFTQCQELMTHSLDNQERWVHVNPESNVGLLADPFGNNFKEKECLQCPTGTILFYMDAIWISWGFAIFWSLIDYILLGQENFCKAYLNHFNDSNLTQKKHLSHLRTAITNSK